MSEQPQTQPNIQTPDTSAGDVYLLGGADREMARIDTRLSRAGAEVVNNVTGWETANVEAYADEIPQIQQEGRTPVAVELRGAENVPGLVDIDHHNEKSDRPASITQVLERLGLEPTLADKMVAANDSAYIPGMNKLIADEVERRTQAGESPERVKRVEKWMNVMKDMTRRGDRQAQGVTELDELEAERAIEQMEDGPNGMKIVRLTGTRPSVVTDRLFDKWPDGKQHLVVICSDADEVKEVWFYGDGKVSQDLANHYKEVRQESIANGSFVEPPATEPRGENHSFSGGAGNGKAGENALALVVSSNPEGVIDYIAQLENEQNAQK